jgi:predicted Holliday junction resolvase-like endonuclease
VVIAQLIGMLTYHILYIKELLKHISPEKGKQQIQELKKTSQGFKKERDELQQNQKELMKEKKQLEKKVEKSSKEKGSPKSEAA